MTFTPTDTLADVFNSLANRVDYHPDALEFPPALNVEPNTPLKSEEIELDGFVKALLSIDGGEFEIKRQGFPLGLRTTPSMARKEDVLQLGAVAPATFDTPLEVAVTVNGSTYIWLIRTRLEGDVTIPSFAQPALAILAPTSYPPTVTVGIPPDATVGDTLTIQALTGVSDLRSFDFGAPDIASTFTLTADPADAKAAIEAAVAGVSSGNTLIRISYTDGTDSSWWSKTVLHGTAAAPALTPPSISQLSSVQMVELLEFSQPTRIELIGADADKLEARPFKPDGSVASDAEAQYYTPAANWRLRWLNNGSRGFDPATDFDGDNTYEFAVDMTGANGVFATSPDVAITLVQADATADQIEFTDQSDATLNQTYTANESRTITGLEPGFQFPLILTDIGSGGTIEIEGIRIGAGTHQVQNGMVLSNPQATAAAVDMVTNGLLGQIGDMTFDFTVATPLGVTPPVAGFAMFHDFYDAANLKQNVDGTGTVADGDPIGFVVDLGPNGIDLVAPANDTRRPVWNAAGSADFLGSEHKILYATSTVINPMADGNAGGWTMVVPFTYRSNGGNQKLFGFDNDPNENGFWACYIDGSGRMSMNIYDGAQTEVLAKSTYFNEASGDELIDGQTYVVVFVYNGSQIVPYIDKSGTGLFAKGVDMSNPANYNTFALGHTRNNAPSTSDPGDSLINQFIYYPFALNAAQIDSVSEWCASLQGRNI